MGFHRCTFVGCTLSVTKKPKLRSMVRNVRLVDCRETGCSAHVAVIEDVLVDGLKTSDLLQTWGAVFKHITLRGRIGSIMLSNAVTPLQPESREQRAFDVANAAYYTGVDWALDLREAELVGDVDLRGVLGRLVRRVPTMSVAITREKAAQGRWRQLNLERTWWPVLLRFFLEDTALDSTVLVVPARVSQRFGLWARQTLLDGLQRLRDAGITEPD